MIEVQEAGAGGSEAPGEANAAQEGQRSMRHTDGASEAPRPFQRRPPPREELPTLPPVQAPDLRFYEITPEMFVIPYAISNIRKRLKERSGLTWKELGHKMGIKRQNVDGPARKRFSSPSLKTMAVYVKACGGKLWVELPSRD